MKRTIIIAAITLMASAAFSSCSKHDDGCGTVTTTAPAAEVATLKQYITSNSINATEDSRGFYYTITSSGSGTPPTVCSGVKVNYVGRLTNGTQFDAANNVSFQLGGLIKGWQEGIPLIAKGGKIVLYLPPSLGYGSAAQSGIPANSILVFTIDLLDVN